VHHATSGDDDPVTSLLDALQMADDGVGVDRGPVDLDGDDLLEAAQVDGLAGERFVAAGQDRWGHRVAVPARWRVGDGDVVGERRHGATLRYCHFECQLLWSLRCAELAR
jgi:hypothetical protein